ncbi:hypothetical protein HELRODRAFT_190716 [Helobdella robusta]|uniref:Uncharacterized protein n=1 Tax=Helobdella robusta TaxID=6412 RepID=T1FS82_HELRO|nr:hypothetical protein HELRODRAFT_190716 [Helobdella robusta]ESO09087.1 hypothetical protein HELRODRAFT_190716 [Helobdella robusta]
MSRVRAEQAEVAAEQARLDSANAHQISTKNLSTVDPNQIRYSISISNLSDTDEKRNPDSQNHVQFAKKDSSSNNPIKQILNNSFRHPSIWSRNNETTIKRLDSSRSQTSYKTFDQNEKTFNSKQDARDACDKPTSSNLTSYNISPNIQTFNKTNLSNPVTSSNKTRDPPPMSDLDFPSSKFSRSDDTSTNVSSFVPQMNVFERNRLKRNKDPIDIFIGGVPKTNTPTPTSSLSKNSPFSSLSPSFANKTFNPPRTNVPKTSSSEQTLVVAQLSNNQAWLRRYTSWSWLFLVTVNLIIAYFILQFLPNYIS